MKHGKEKIMKNLCIANEIDLRRRYPLPAIEYENMGNGEITYVLYDENDI